jgi:peroxiredoxin
MMKKIILLHFILGVCLTSFSQNVADVKRKSSKSTDPGEALYQKVIGADFPVSELMTIDNELLNLKSFKGKLVFINFWFKACAPCIAEMKGLKKLYDKFENDSIVFIMISYEPDVIINEVRNKYALDFKMVSIRKDIISKWDIPKGYPTTILLDKTGKIIYGRSGGKSNEETATKDVLEIFGRIIQSNLVTSK